MKIGIVAHKSRLVMADQLARKVRADYISVDRGNMMGAVANHRNVWSRLSAVCSNDEWCLVLEDDAVIGKDFSDQLMHVCYYNPTNVDVISLYLGKLRPPHWQDRIAQAIARADSCNACWITSDFVLHGVAMAMRGSTISKMLDITEESSRPLDESMSMWVRKFGHRIGYCWPSIVDHADEPTLIKHMDGQERIPGRIAHRFGSREIWNSSEVKL